MKNRVYLSLFRVNASSLFVLESRGPKHEVANPGQIASIDYTRFMKIMISTVYGYI